MKPNELTLVVDSERPRWTRFSGLRIEIEIFSKRRHSLDFRIAKLRVPFGHHEQTILIPPSQAKSIVVTIGGPFSPVHHTRIRIVALPEREAPSDTLAISVAADWDLGNLDTDVTATWLPQAPKQS